MPIKLINIKVRKLYPYMISMTICTVVHRVWHEIMAIYVLMSS